MGDSADNRLTRQRVVVTGLVQGVFFRDSLRREAQDVGVAGWVRNNDDGSVEAAFEGSSDAVERLVSWCRSGPRNAHVEHVDVTRQPAEGLRGFRIR